MIKYSLWLVWAGNAAQLQWGQRSGNPDCSQPPHPPLFTLLLMHINASCLPSLSPPLFLSFFLDALMVLFVFIHTREIPQDQPIQTTTFNRRAEHIDNTTHLSGPTHTSMCKHTRLCMLINNSTVSVHILPNTSQQECLHADTHTLTHIHTLDRLFYSTHSCHEGQITKSIRVTQNRSLHYTAAVVWIDWELFTSYLGCVQIRVRLKPSLLQSNFSFSTCLKGILTHLKCFRNVRTNTGVSTWLFTNALFNKF